MGVQKDKSLGEGIALRFLDAMRDIIYHKVKGVENQQQFGEIVNEYYQNFSKMKTGGRQPTLESLARLCNYFGVSPEWLLLDLGEMYGQASRKLKVNDSKKLEELDLRLKKIEQLVISKPSKAALSGKISRSRS